MAKWRQGDLGRFFAESPKRPRFEVVGPSADRLSVEVWYGGQPKPETILVDTFKKDCTNLWELQEVVPPLPTWVKEGAMFEFPHSGQVSIRQAEIHDPRYHRLTHATTVTLSGQKVQIRRIRRDYTSCLVGPLLVLVPLATIAKFGIQRLTRWERIMSDEDPFEEENDDDLFKGL